MKLLLENWRKYLNEEHSIDSGPMTPKEQQKEFDRLVDSGSEPKELKAMGKYPDVDSLSSDVATRYYKRKYDWLNKEKISVDDIHKRADKLGIPWDNDAQFMSWTKELTGKSHLDDLTSEELSKVYAALKKRSSK